MDDPNITMEEYIRLEEVKARRHDLGNDKPFSPSPTVDYFDDLDYFKDLKNEFPVIVYNDGLTSKSDLGIKPLINSECIDELKLINETSLSEYDEGILSRFNDLFNDIHPDNLKLKKDDDDNDVCIIQSSEDNEITHGENGFSKTTLNQRHPWLRYQIEEYTEEISKDEVGSGSEVEDGIFWQGIAGICKSYLEAVVWDLRAFSLRVYYGVPEYLQDE
ncbi:hypothetical protein Tco_1301521 [Tanacetum coccineum]